jgi:hypothetical protein
MRAWVKAVLFLSSISPMFFILFVQNFNFASFMGTGKAHTSIFLIEPAVVWCFIGLSILPNLVLFIILNKSKRAVPINATITSIETRSGDVLNYMATYVIPLISFKTDKINDLAVFILLLIVLMIIYMHTQMFFINPILILLRYRIVEVNDSLVIITKADLRINDKVKMHSIDNQIYLGVKS